jgi:hypothetical protein
MRCTAVIGLDVLSSTTAVEENRCVGITHVLRR